MILHEAVERDRLKQFELRFEDIKSGNNKAIKAARLAVLQDDMEQVFKIPLIGKECAYEFRSDNPEIMRLYRQVVRERDVKPDAIFR
ncbi:hypothetical protein F9U64_19135 [Gracilibacillus oryzae]|uniref:Uncharacterized protein n=1 Tax=Gracilibacillus oryzae TaxID=1672701 RepID=A0A7C8GR35_9BACI|nr:hypothetical protein [Gracilibacillus oryzae]KAB8126933.1 hypothetical protein F9U64_19135 [Gracilibacillus oryzae]